MHRLELEDRKVKGNMFIDYSEEEYNKESLQNLNKSPFHLSHTVNIQYKVTLPINNSTLKQVQK